MPFNARLLAATITLLGLTGCTITPLPTPVTPFALPPLGPAAADGLAIPNGPAVETSETGSFVGALRLASLLRPANVRERIDPALKLTGFDGLKDGAFFAASGDDPRVSAKYTLRAEPDSLLGSLAQPLQPAHLPLWLAHPGIQGYCYVNDLLGGIEGIDRFLTSDSVAGKLRVSNLLGEGEGLTDVLRDIYQVSFDQDLNSWWDGEFLMVWLPDDSWALHPVYLFGVHRSDLAADKAQQMLAMYYFFKEHDRGVFAAEPIGPGLPTMMRLMDYAGGVASLDMAYVVGTDTLILGPTESVKRLLTPETKPTEAPPPAAAFAWEANTLFHQPKSFAFGLEGGEQAERIASGFFEKGVGLMPGGGRELAGQMGSFFSAPGIQEVMVNLEPKEFQWWVRGAAAEDPQGVKVKWNGAQVLAILAIAGMPGWDDAAEGSVMAPEAGEGDESPRTIKKSTTTRTRRHRPFWRSR
ncbi:MAG: hypothetical protein ABI743_00565 [bacterium]